LNIKKSYTNWVTLILMGWKWLLKSYISITEEKKKPNQRLHTCITNTNIFLKNSFSSIVQKLYISITEEKKIITKNYMHNNTDIFLKEFVLHVINDSFKHAYHVIINITMSIYVKMENNWYDSCPYNKRP
jgi:hypothetical protein